MSKNKEMSATNRGLTSPPQPPDYNIAYGFATEQITRIKCKDFEILKLLCDKLNKKNPPPSPKLVPEKGCDLSWNIDTEPTLWNLPYFFPPSVSCNNAHGNDDCLNQPSSGGSQCIKGTCSCKTDKDCGAKQSSFCIIPDKQEYGQCQFNKTTDYKDTLSNYIPYEDEGQTKRINILDFSHGDCKITTPNLCKASSVLPYKETGHCTTTQRQAIGNGAGCSINPAAVVYKCPPKKDDDDDKDNCAGIDTSTYTEWDPANNKCIFGNFELKKYCEYPSTRLACAKCQVASDSNDCTESAVL